MQPWMRSNVAKVKRQGAAPSPADGWYIAGKGATLVSGAKAPRSFGPFPTEKAAAKYGRMIFPLGYKTFYRDAASRLRKSLHRGGPRLPIANVGAIEWCNGHHVKIVTQ